MNILLAEDDRTCRTLLGRIIRQEPQHQLVEAANGEEAWTLLCRQSPRFDLGIIDVNMPGLDGISLVERIRADSRLRTMPLILCTAQNDRGTVEHACLLSVDHFIVKPFSRTVVLEKLRLVASRISTHEASDSIETIADRLGVDAATVKELTGHLRVEVREMLAAACKEQLPDNFRRLAVAANGLKGAALSLGLGDLSVELDRAEHAFIVKFADPLRSQFPPSVKEVALELAAVELELAKIESQLLA
jgi:DNA-binding response OmpR family regulator